MGAKPIIDKIKENPAVVIITMFCTIIPVLISLGTIGVAFNDRVYASKQDIADLNVKVEKRTAVINTKLDMLLAKSGYTMPRSVDDSINASAGLRRPEASRRRDPYYWGH